MGRIGEELFPGVIIPAEEEPSVPVPDESPVAVPAPPGKEPVPV